MEAKALAYSARSEISFVPAAVDVHARSGEVLVRPHFTGICGTDLLIWHDGHSRATPQVVLGHEFAGEVIGLGEGVDGISIGDRVAVEPLIGCGDCAYCLDGEYNKCAALRLIGVDVDGSLAPSVRVPVERILVLPDGLDSRAGAFIEPTAVVCHLLRRVGELPTESAVFIAGGGPIGLIAAEILVRRGHRVLLAESNEFRASVGRRLGAEVVSSFEEAERRATAMAVRFSACLEATGVPDALATCVRIASPGGVVGIVGLPKSEPELDATAIIGKELDIRGSRVYVRADFEEAARLIEAGLLSLDEHISHTIDFEQSIIDGFEAVERRDPILKIMIDQRETSSRS